MENDQNSNVENTILRTSTNYLLPLLILFSIFVLLRGHYLSGGGFVGGLIASIAFVLHSFAYSPKETINLFRFQPMFLIPRSEEHTSELQSRPHLVCRLLLEKKNKKKYTHNFNTH